MLKHALLPLSLKERLQRLNDMATYIKHFGTEKIYLCHILEGTSSRKRDKAENQLKQIANQYQDLGFETETVIESGNVAGEVCRLTKELQVDYIAIKWKRKNVIKRTILGSPDADILRICNFPTFIYKTRNYLDPRRDINTVLYATDFQETDEKVAPYIRAASQSGENLYILHVRDRAPDPETDSKRREEVLEKLNWLTRQYMDCYQQVESVVRTGNIRSEIPRNVRRLNVDLIVIGKKDKQEPIDKLIGSTAESVPYKVYSSIFIVP